MKILQIEADGVTAQTVELMLKAEGFNVYTTDLGEEGGDLARVYDYDLITLDLNLPDVSGLEVLRRLRAAKIDTPVLIVTGDTRVETKIRALEMGADDYLTKPFHRGELIARAHAVIRRSRGLAKSVVQVGELQIDLSAKTAAVAGNAVPLTGREYQMLELLMLRKGMTLTKEMFLNHLYGGMDEPELKIIDVYICKIRNKLRPFGANGLIATVWGRGYVLREPAAGGVGA